MVSRNKTWSFYGVQLVSKARVGRRQVMRPLRPADHLHRSQPPIQPPAPATRVEGTAADNKWTESRNLCLWRLNEEKLPHVPAEALKCSSHSFYLHRQFHPNLSPKFSRFVESSANNKWEWQADHETSFLFGRRSHFSGGSTEMCKRRWSGSYLSVKCLLRKIQSVVLTVQPIAQ